MLHGVKIFFENEFIGAQRIFASQDQVNPIYALGSGALAFMKGTVDTPLSPPTSQTQNRKSVFEFNASSDMGIELELCFSSLF